MPPKTATVAAPSPSPPPPEPNDVQDILVIADMADTLDQIPNELTRVHSDLNELAAVLYATLINLESKLDQLVQWIQDPNIGQHQRFQLLQEIAEEAARYKLGGDDKIRVAGGACDGMQHHQRHISNLLDASTLLLSGPPSPYTQSLTLPHPQPLANTRRGVLARAANSPFGGRGYAAAAGGTDPVKEKETPSKKKKSRVAQLGAKDDDEVSSVGGKRAPVKKRKPANRAVSPTDSLASTSAFTGKPVEPRTARQLAAAANRARQKEDWESEADEGNKDAYADSSFAPQDSAADKTGLGLNVGGQSREGSGQGRSANATPVNSGANRNGGRARAAGQKRSRADDEDDDLGDEEEVDQKPAAKKSTAKKSTTQTPYVAQPEPDLDTDGVDPDMTPYCICQRHSYGEMIGCDNDDCEYEWFHVACVGLTKPPEGDWTCPRCTEKLKKNPLKRKAGKAKASK